MDKFDVMIKLVKKLPKNDCGYCVTRNKKKTSYEIGISESAHKTVSDFGSTLLHELLHLWIYILGRYGYRVKLKYEHKFIYAVETVLVEFMHILNEGKNDKIKKRKKK